MAWTAFPTWAVGQVSTASDWNTYVANNMSFLASAPCGKAYNNTSGALTNIINSFTVPTVVFLNGGVTAPSSNLMVPVAGYYQVNIQCQASLSATGQLLSAIAFKNGSVIGQGSSVISTGAQNLGTAWGDIVLCAAGDVFLPGYNWTGGGSATLADNEGSGNNYISLVKVSQ